MGKFDFQFDQGLTRQLERLSDYENIAPKILEGAVPILTRRVQDETAKHKRTADLLNSIKKTGAKKNKYGWYITVKPTGTDRNGIRNMEKMAYAEYGTSKQSPTPILSKALNDARDEVTEKMQEIFSEAVNGE